MYVVCHRKIFLNPFNWKVFNKVATACLGSIDSSPCKSLLVMTASYTQKNIFFLHVVFNKQNIIFLWTAIVAEIRFLISCFGSPLCVTLMPRYLTSSDAFFDHC